MKATKADETRFLEMVTENRSRILRVCRVYAWNGADQEDLYQEILCQVWRGLPGLKEQQFANTWLYRVAINTAISFERKRASSAGRVIHVEHAYLTTAIESRQEIGEENDGRMANLFAAIYKLNTVEKAVVTLFLEDLTYEQISEATGIQPSNVGVILHRAKKKLLALMKEELAE